METATLNVGMTSANQQSTGPFSGRLDLGHRESNPPDPVTEEHMKSERPDDETTRLESHENNGDSNGLISQRFATTIDHEAGLGRTDASYVIRHPKSDPATVGTFDDVDDSLSSAGWSVQLYEHDLLWFDVRQAAVNRVALQPADGEAALEPVEQEHKTYTELQNCSWETMLAEEEEEQQQQQQPLPAAFHWAAVQEEQEEREREDGDELEEEGQEEEEEEDRHLAAYLRHPGATIYKCVKCDYGTKQKASFAAHVRVVHDHNASLYGCVECDFVTKQRFRLTAHVKEQHHKPYGYRAGCWGSQMAPNARQQRCYNCYSCDCAAETCLNVKNPRSVDKCTEHERSSYRRSRNNGATPAYKCPHCRYVTEFAGRLDGHVRTKHGPDAQLYRCRECEYTTGARTNLNSHVKVWHDPDARLYQCPHCSYATKMKSNLFSHVRRKHDPNADVHKCPECEYTTKTRSNLVTHVRVKHGNDRGGTQRCGQCQFATRFKAKLEAHVKLKHSGGGNNRCGECRYTAKSRMGLVRHVKVKHGAKRTSR